MQSKRGISADGKTLAAMFRRGLCWPRQPGAGRCNKEGLERLEGLELVVGKHADWSH